MSRAASAAGLSSPAAGGRGRGADLHLHRPGPPRRVYHAHAGRGRELTAELTSLYVRYKNALRAVLPAGATRPAEVAELGPSAVACIRSTLLAQAELASAILGDVERLAARSRSARAVC